MRRGLAPGGTNRACVVVDDAGCHVAPLERGKREPAPGPPPWDVAQGHWRAGGCSAMPLANMVVR